MNKPTEILIGGVVGVVASELLKEAIAGTKKVCAFTPVSTELASAMIEVLPLVTQIESLQDVEELKTLTGTIRKALVLIGECSGVQPLDLVSKSIYTTRVEEINKEMVKFCQIQVSLILLRNQGQSSLTINNSVQVNSKKLDLLIAHAPPANYSYRRDLCSVPNLDKVSVGFDWPLMKLKNMLFNDSVDSLLVSAPPGCGKTTLVTQLCHDQEIKGKFKHIFFNVVSSTPNFRVIVQNLLQCNGHPPHTLFENVSQATVGLRKLLEELREDGPILLVLDDVWHGAEFSFLEKFRNIKLPGYKILVTSRFDLLSFDFTYPLKPLGDKDAKSLLIQWASPPLHTSPDEYEHLFQKILKRCSGFPIVIEVVGISLKGKPLHIWKGQVESWSEGKTILGNPHTTVLKCLQPSFNALKPHLKDTCFRNY